MRIEPKHWLLGLLASNAGIAVIGAVLMVGARPNAAYAGGPIDACDEEEVGGCDCYGGGTWNPPGCYADGGNEFDCLHDC